MDMKRLANIAGSVLVLLSIVFIGVVLSRLDFAPLLARLSWWWIPTLLGLSLLLCFCYLFLAFAWRRLLELASRKRLDMEVTARYLYTVVFKYAPGNVFHFLGRHALKESHRLSHKSIMFANGAEIILQLFSVSLIIFAGALIFGFSLDITAGFTLSRTKILLAFGLLMGLSAVMLLKKRNREILFSKEGLSGFLFVTGNHLLFLLGSTSILFLVYLLFFDLPFTLHTFSQTVFVGVIAWLLGFVVPGAPGGIGIRESVLLLMLPQAILLDRESVIAGALLYRIVTIGGEVMTLLLSGWISEKRGVYVQ
ncbi:MAG: hypothetical protein B6D59_03635 [Campylobacteraceae bacterium 4484_4]|nr:MAG: hypothetical protein B6D59_03635 [Campylobacteraceae bacterium 4484_4]